MLPSLGWNKGKPTVERCYFMEVIDLTYLTTVYFTTILFPTAILIVIYACIYRAVKQQVSYLRLHLQSRKTEG